MKKSLIILAALLATIAVKAQQIAVVSASGSPSLYQDLNDAITGATSGIGRDMAVILAKKGIDPIIARKSY